MTDFKIDLTLKLTWLARNNGYLSFCRDSIASFTGKVISTKNPESEKLFLKPGAKKNGKEKGEAASKAVKKTKKAVGSQAGPKIGSKTDPSAPRKKKEKAEPKEEAKENVDKEAFEAWCKKQNRHFDDCESFELSIEYDESEEL